MKMSLFEFLFIFLYSQNEFCLSAKVIYGWGRMKINKTYMNLSEPHSHTALEAKRSVDTNGKTHDFHEIGYWFYHRHCHLRRILNIGDGRNLGEFVSVGIEKTIRLATHRNIALLTLFAEDLPMPSFKVVQESPRMEVGVGVKC
uniref:Uncharacterized protein n=1 Tax=Sphaerodactylus townsendi TaxID=933632 RepID=A0ACB8EYK4_9SAUR